MTSIESIEHASADELRTAAGPHAGSRAPACL